MQFDLKSILTYLLMAIIIAIIPIITKVAISFFKSFSAEKIEKIKNENIKNIVKDAEDLVCQAVMHISQTFVESLKKSGDFTEIQQEKAFDKAKEEVIELIPNKTVDTLSDLYGDFDLWLDSKIEQMVLTLKNTKK